MVCCKKARDEKGGALIRPIVAVFFALAAIGCAQNIAPNAHDLLARGEALITSKPAEAVKLLQQALQLDPELPGLHYQLGLAYHAIGDEAEAEPELRDAVRRTPDSAAARNSLGIVLFQMGDAKSALQEFRAAATIAPKDPNVHFNLGEAMARTGDNNGAVAELRVAAGLAPTDAGLTRLLVSVETKIAAPEGAIKVDVRQVLVPVVVKDAQGHPITGLKQADFRVFEDGVEQKITAFSVESAGVAEAGILSKSTPEPAPPTPAPAAPTAASAAGPRRTYMILLDTLHTSFEHMANAREALVKLFREEHSADSQYGVIALGISPQVVIQITRDASAVLAVLESKRMQKVWLDGQLGGIQGEMTRLRRDLVDIRYACDQAANDSALEVKCAAGLQRVTQQSQQIRELDFTLTAEFLSQLRSIVAQLARARDRRTVLLVSDGFEITPGREALALVNAYFPPASHCLVPLTVFCPPNGQMSTSRMADQFEPILSLAAAGNVTIDTIDSRGLFAEKTFDASSAGTSPTVDSAVGRVERDTSSALGNTLREIAASTGGTAFHDNNDLLPGFQRAFADGRDYYNIAYVPANGNFDGKFRAITVQVRDPKAVVSAKRGYWASPGAQ